MSAADLAPYEMASPTLLAQQPPSLPPEAMETESDWNTVFPYLESRLGMLRTIRWPRWSYWGELARYILPRRYKWVISANLFNKGTPINQAIIDSTATLAMKICSSGMVDGLVPTTRPWFKITIGTPGADLEPDAKAWCEDTEERAYTVLAGSNFYNIMAQVAQDEVVFGSSPVIMYEDAEDVIRCYSPCAGEYYLAVGSRFSVDTLYREFTLTVAQIVEMFTLKACPEQIRQLWEAGGASIENEFVVAHAIEPNFPISGRGRKKNSKIDVVKGGFVYREVYWLRSMKTDRELSKRGFNGRPFATFRWATTSNDPYADSPGTDALGDIKQLQLETMRKAEAIEKQVRPPMGADPSMKNEPASINPAQITYIDTTNNKKGFWPLFEMKFDLSALSQDLKDIQTRIDRAFLVDVFMAITQMEGVQPRNNMEIAERKGEKMQRLGPVIGLWKTEGIEPLLRRLLDIMQRRRLLKPMPKSMQGHPLKFEFMDMVTLAQLGAKTAGMEQTFAVGGKLSEAAKAAGLPDPLRVFNLDQSMRIYADDMNFPQAGIFAPDEVAQHDQIRADAKKPQQISEATLPAVTAAKTLSETNLAGNTALSAMLGQGPGAVQAP